MFLYFVHAFLRAVHCCMYIFILLIFTYVQCVSIWIYTRIWATMFMHNSRYSHRKCRNSKNKTPNCNEKHERSPFTILFHTRAVCVRMYCDSFQTHLLPMAGAVWSHAQYSTAIDSIPCTWFVLTETGKWTLLRPINIRLFVSTAQSKWRSVSLDRDFFMM